VQSLDSQLRILFIGLAQSSHTHSWINLFSGAGLDIRLFGIHGTVAPPEFTFPVESTGACSLANMNRSIRLRVIGRILKLWNRYVTSNPTFLPVALGSMSRLDGNQRFWIEHADSEWIAEIIQRWKPDVIHSLGLEPASYCFSYVRLKFGLRKPAWVVTARGGPELALGRLDPEIRTKIAAILKECDGFIADNDLNLKYGIQLGLDPCKIIPGGIIPGTGGVDADSIRALRLMKPSKQRIILWPKAYDCPASKSLPVLEAFKLAWPRIAPCTIHLTATDTETVQWFRTLPSEIVSSCVVHDRIPHKQLLELMASSRILLAPSMIDGVPNTLYEAMASGAFPIFSPLDTFKDLVKSGENILFARNLYPQEIADALIRAMSDDALVDSAAERNFDLVQRLANRSAISERMIDFYRSLAASKR